MVRNLSAFSKKLKDSDNVTLQFNLLNYFKSCYQPIKIMLSTKKSKLNLPQGTRMEPARKKITRTPQSHLEAHSFGGMREEVFWLTTSSCQKPPSMEAEDGWPMEYGYKVSK
jgi:hypothetical protein